MQELKDEYYAGNSIEMDILFYYIITNGGWALRVTCEDALQLMLETFLSESDAQRNVYFPQFQF